MDVSAVSPLSVSLSVFIVLFTTEEMDRAAPHVAVILQHAAGAGWAAAVSMASDLSVFSRRERLCRNESVVHNPYTHSPTLWISAAGVCCQLYEASLLY